MSINRSKAKLYALVGVTTLTAGLVLQACSGSSSGGNLSLGVTAPSTTGASAQFQVGVYQSGSSTNLVAGNNVAQFITGAQFTVNASSTVNGAMTLTCTDTDLPAQPHTSLALASGANTVTAPSPGDYTCVVSQAGVTGAAQFNLAVTCANPTAPDLSHASITASASSGSNNNVFDFGVSGITGGQPGTQGYLCAWDFLGDGIQDTLYTPCSSGAPGVYVPYVGSHRVGLLVRDSCNAFSKTYSLPITFADTVPPTGQGNVFIYGAVSNPTGSASSDLRVTQPSTGPITYLATNQGSPFAYGQTVIPGYTAGSTTSAFTIKSSLQYSGPSSAPQGAEFDISNIAGTVDAATMTSTLATGPMTLPMNVSFTTDDSGDAEPSVKYQGSCNLTNAHTKTVLIQGSGCGTEGGDNNEASVELWGNYACTLTAPDGSMITLTGELDGVYYIVDTCIPGGGQEGGGPPPPGF